MNKFPFVNELLDYIYKKDTEQYECRYKAIEKGLSKESEEYIELLLINLTFYYLTLGNLTKLKELAIQYEPLVMLHGSDSQKALFLIRQGVAYSLLKDDISALESYKRSLKLCKSKSMSQYKFGNYVNIGIIYNRQYKYHKALNQFLKAYQLDELPENSLKTTSILSNIGITYLNIEDFQHAIDFFNLALKTSTKNQDIALPKILDNLIIAYSLNKDVAMAESTIDLYNRKKDTFVAKVGLSHVKALGTFYNAKKDYNKAIEQYNILLNKLLPKENNPESVRDQLDLAGLYLEISDLDNFTSNIESIKDSPLLSTIPNAYKKLLLLEIDFYKLTNEPIKALEYASKLNVYLENKYNDIFQRSIIEDTKTLVNKFGGIAETALEDKVSELKTTNKELYSQKALLLESFEELKTETQLREKLISIITHDIRSPLASILELLQQIDDFEDKAERDEIIREIISEMNKTYSLTNELVSWAKDVREGQQTMLSTLTCAELIPDITELFSHQIKAKDVRIHNNLTDKYKIIAHKTSLQTCFRNLIQNAIKYSNPQGNIWINEVVRGDSISYLIKDEGIGINGETCSKLFDSANISTMGTNNEKGIGLGLILVKELVFRNKGSIKCDSEIGQGTTFTLTFKIDSVKESDNSQEEYSA